MQRLSSPLTVFYKRVFPAFWFGFLALFTVVWASGAAVTHRHDMWSALLIPMVMLVMALALFRRLIFDLVDEVWLDGEQLVIKNRGVQSRIDLSTVLNVNASTLTNPPRITLMLRRASSSRGDSVAFMPTGARGFFAAFKPHPIAVDLNHRIAVLRRGAA